MDSWKTPTCPWDGHSTSMALSDNVVFTELLVQELDDMLKEYDMKRDSVEINHDAPQWSHHAVWNQKYMEPKPGYTLEQLWADSEPAISKKNDHVI